MSSENNLTASGVKTEKKRNGCGIAGFTLCAAAAVMILVWIIAVFLISGKTVSENSAANSLATLMLAMSLIGAPVSCTGFILGIVGTAKGRKCGTGIKLSVTAIVIGVVFTAFFLATLIADFVMILVVGLAGAAPKS